jgi:MFS family permease
MMKFPVNRWTILAVLFTARLTMAFQFQSIAALSPFLETEYGISLTQIGVLIGLYFMPGLVVAIGGSAVAARFGEARTVAFSLVLMLTGVLLVILIPGDASLTAGRLISGVGGVIRNVVMTKLLVDWFVGKEISTALALFVNSWPVGIALALLVLPPVSAAGGLAAAWWITATIIAAGLVLFVTGYRPPEGAVQGPARIRFGTLPYAPLSYAGLIWALYNAALAMVFSFGPTILIDQGWSLSAAGAMISAYMVVISVAVSLGGIVADKTGRRDAVIASSMVAFILCMPLLPSAGPALVGGLLLVSGALFALAAGPIMTLPSLVLSDTQRTFGMGVFFTIYYGAMLVAPGLAGGLADRAGNPGLALSMGAVLCAICLVLLWMFRRRMEAIQS